MKKLLSLALLACCLFACSNPIDKKLDELEKACAANDIEKADEAYQSLWESIGDGDVSRFNSKQAARWTEVTMKYSTLKTQDIMEQSTKKTQEIMDQYNKILGQ